MNIETFTVSRDTAFHHGWPDLTAAPDGSLVCVFSECTSHCVRPYTRIMFCRSTDEGRTWSPKEPLNEGTAELAFYWNCPRISTMPDGRVVIIVDRIPRSGEEGGACNAENLLYTSHDNGKTWSAGTLLPLKGIVPDKYRFLNNNRLATAAHYALEKTLTQFLRYSDDNGATWSEPVTVAHDDTHHFCEVSLLPMGGETVVALMRENSGMGYDCFKAISADNGATWSEPVPFPIPGCHRPAAGFLKDGRILITYRFHQGGLCGKGNGAQNFFGALTDRASLLADTRQGAAVRIFPIDYDRSPKADTGYSGWVQLPDNSIYAVNYIVDDAVTHGQIRGYRITLEDLLIDSPLKRCALCNCPKESCHRY